MAKMVRWERAWGYFLQAFYKNRVHKSDCCSKRKHPDQIGYYWKLVGALQKLGVSIWLSRDLGESVDAYGRAFTVGGCWNRRNDKISLLYRNFSILAHEAAHAINDMLDGTGRRYSSEGELVAAAVGYLLTCEYMGIHSPGFDVRYAKRQGATPKELARLEDHILAVFRETKSLLDT